MIWKFPYYDINSGIDWVSIQKNYDWFREMEDIPQDKIWHSEGNVQIHTKMVCEALINLPEFKELDEQDKHIMVTSALMHDIEKRSTTAFEERDGRMCVVAPKHAKKGEYTARQILYKDIVTPFHIREEICKLVKYHGEPLWKNADLERTVVEISFYTSNYKLAMLSKADVLGRICPDTLILLDKIEFFKLAAETFGCLHGKRMFESDLSRYHYFTKETFIDYVPYDETKFNVILVSGIAGSGKDYYINKNITLPMISLDAIRREKGIKPTDSKGNGQVIQEAMELCKVKMRKKESFVFNATNITKDLRNKWISLFEEYGAKVDIHYIETPYKDLLKQNVDREFPIPTEVVHNMIKKLEIPEFNECNDIKFIIN